MATTQQLLQQKEAREAYEREQKIRMKQKELDKQKKSTSLLDEGTDTLTIINKDTGEVVRQGTTGTGGRSGGGTGLPSVTGGGLISQISQEDIERIMKNQPSQTLNLKQEKILQSELSKPIQEVSFDPKFGFDSKILTNAAKYLTIPQNKRTPQMQADIAYAYATTPAQRNYELQEAFRKAMLEQPNSFNITGPMFFQPEIRNTGSLRQKKGNILERLGKTSEEAEKNISEGKISGGFQKTGQILQNIGKEIYEQKPKIPFLSNKYSTAKIYERAQLLSSPKEDLLSFATFLTWPFKLGGSIISGGGQTVETAGDIIEAASKRETWEDVGSAAIGAGKYLFDVGYTADISFYEKDLKGHKIKLPIPIITPSEKVKQDIEKTTVLIGDIATGVVEEYINAPIKATGELIGSGIVISGATSLAKKMIGFGKAGIATIKGGKYVPYEKLFETNPKNLLQGKYKKGTEKTVIKEFKTGKNPKELLSVSSNPIIKKGETKAVIKHPAPENLPSTDVLGAYASTGSANEVYARISGSIYNLKPRIPFINMPSKTSPTVHRFIGSTVPKKLRDAGKFSNLKQAKKVYYKNTESFSKNIPFTSPALATGTKIENEVLLREGARITKKGIKGTHDFTFIKGTFVDAPRIRLMPSKPTKKPSILSKERISKVIKPKKEVSFLRALEQSRSPGTFYNPAPLIRRSLSKTKSVNVPRIISRPSRTTSKPSSSSSRITSRPSLSISRSISRPSTSTSRTISRPSSSTSRTITRPSTSTSRTTSRPSTSTSRTITRPSTSTSRTISRPRPSTSTGSGTGFLTSPPPSRIKSSTSSKNNRTQNPAYDVYVRKTLPGTKKVAPQLVARNVPINKGINEGTRIASRYTQRTVQLKRTGYTSMPDESLNRQRLMQYRGFKPTSKIRRQTINLVEKSKYTIDSYEEKQGIPYKGQQVRKKQAFIKKLRLI